MATLSPASQSAHRNDEDRAPESGARWTRLYAGVLAFLVLQILFYYFFMEFFR